MIVPSTLLPDAAEETAGAEVVVRELIEKMHLHFNRSNYLIFALHGILIFILTVVTQVGGVIYLLSLLVSRVFKFSLIKFYFLFFGFYLLCTLFLVPNLAPFFGRVPLPVKGCLKPLTIATVILNRHYVKPSVKKLLISSSEMMATEFPGTTTHYLDANFPFCNGFPLFPHLSHNDGKKVDLAFFYKNASDHKFSNNAPSPIGYGVYDAPKQDEVNYTDICKTKGFWQYDFIHYLVPQHRAKTFTTDEERTIAILKILANLSETSKVFIEPHLKKRWNLMGYAKIRFHGCHAVRHDDHIHWQIK